MDHKQDKKIMVVDDKPVNIKMLVKTLQRHRYTNIITVEDAREAMREFTQNQPDIVLLDLNMPYVSGYEIISMIRESEFNDVPIIILTADMNVEMTKRAVLDAGASEIFFKPLVLADVMAAVERLIHQG